MIAFDAILEDLELKRAAALPHDELPVSEARTTLPEPPAGIRVTDDAGVAGPYDPARAARLVGDALATLALARGQVAVEPVAAGHVTRAALARVHARLAALGEATLSRHDVSALIEAALVQEGEFEVAKALVVRRALPPAAPTTATAPRLIRRSGQVVAWNTAKIARAIARAFLSSAQEPTPAAPLAERVAERAAGLGSAYVPIETVQDLVQEELVLAGHMRVAERFIVYRAERALLRAERNAPAPVAAPIAVAEPDGGIRDWDGGSLRAAIAFASIGLDLPLDAPALERELRRSVAPGISRADLERTVVLNARSLVERDPAFGRFAGRILLCRVYAETLGWDVLRERSGGDVPAEGFDIDRCVGGLAAAHRRGLRRALEHGVAIDRVDPRMLDYDLDALAAALDPTADLDFDLLGLQTLYDRYLLQDRTGAEPRRFEAPQIFWMRVAMGVCLGDPAGPREARVVDLYTAYKARRFCSSTPTLFNAGTPHSQLSSCYVYVVEDTLESIMGRGVAENAMCSKWAGGLGGSWTRVRGSGAHIAGTNGASQGVVPFLKLHNDQLVAVNQGGKRAGSGCAYLEVWHNDIRDFLELRRGTGDERRRTHDMNTACWVPDLFMQRMHAREEWTLFRSSDVPELHDLYGRAFAARYEAYESEARDGRIFCETIPALDLWKLMLRSLYETGHPWITFKDPCNVRSPQDHAGVIHSSNLCTEITLNTSTEETAVCNLGSIVLDEHLDADGELDHEQLRATVRIAVRALDDVIDVNLYPTGPARTANSRHRPVGLGVMGLQRALQRRGAAFASPEAVEFSDEMMEAIAFYAYEASSDLAAERGRYSSYAGSKWERGLLPQDTLELLEAERGAPVEVPRGGRMDWTPLREKIARQGMRNSNVLAIAPTATIANIVGTSPCIEPHYTTLYVKSNLSGDFVVLDAALVADLKAAGVWSAGFAERLKYADGDLNQLPEVPPEIRERHRTAFEIEPRWLIEAAARRQKWIDQSQSLNLFLAAPDLKALSHMYRHAWSAGLKTTYYLRTLGASSIEKSTVSAPVGAAVDAPAPPPSGSSPEAGPTCGLGSGGEDCEACQ